MQHLYSIVPIACTENEDVLDVTDSKLIAQTRNEKSLEFFLDFQHYSFDVCDHDSIQTQHCLIHFK